MCSARQIAAPTTKLFTEFSQDVYLSKDQSRGQETPQSVGQFERPLHTRGHANRHTTAIEIDSGTTKDGRLRVGTQHDEGVGGCSIPGTIAVRTAWVARLCYLSRKKVSGYRTAMETIAYG